MDESVGMLSVAAVLILGIWLVDYSGDAARASTSVHAASVEAAHYAASALASPPPTTIVELDSYAADIAEHVVDVAAVSACDTADPRFDVAAAVHRLPGSDEPAALSVEVTCPLAVSSLFTDTVSSRIAVPVPTQPGAGS